MKNESESTFAIALKELGIKPLEFCRAITALTGKNYSPVMTSRWIHGVHEAPPPVLALVAALGRLPKEELLELIAAPPRKKYTRKEKPAG